MKKLLPLLLVFCIACVEENPVTGPTEEETNALLVDNVLLTNVSQSELRNAYNFVSLGIPDIDLSSLINSISYEVEYYKISYRSTYKGSSITASGVVIVPLGANNPPLLSFNHGTILKKDRAPSLFPSNNNPGVSFFTEGAIDRLLFGLASLGYVGVVADYFGFGDSADVFHPYIVAESSSRAVIDMIAATKEFLRQKRISFSDRLFLMGYSEGGYVTAVTLRELEQSGVANIIATSIGASVINPLDILKDIVSQSQYSSPFYLPYVYLAYKSTYGWDTDTTDFVVDPYAQRIDNGLFDGSRLGSEVDEELTNDIRELLAPSFLAEVSNATSTNIVIEALKRNSWYDWTPTTRTRIYHGDGDTTLKYSFARDYVSSRPSGVGNLELITLTNLDHGTAFFPYLFQTILWFESLK